MPDLLIARSALAAEDGATLRMHGDPATVRLREMPASGMIDLRLDPADTESLRAVEEMLGFRLPMRPNKSTSGAARSALWFGPDQWLLVVQPGDPELLERALAGRAASVVDVSDLRAVFELSGPRARDVLLKGCAVDLHPRVFRTGDCALTALARVRVAVRQVGDEPAYRVFVERSVAEYLWDWLTDAMREYMASA